MFENPGVLLPIWLLVAPLVGAAIDYARIPKTSSRRSTGTPHTA